MSASASSSSSRLASSSSSTSFTPPPRLVADLTLLRDPVLVTDKLWNETTEASVLWLLSLHPPFTSQGADAAGKGKGKERAAVDDDGVATDESLVHWFCGAKGAKGCWEPATFCIRLLGMKKQGEVATWREKFDRYVVAEVYRGCTAPRRCRRERKGLVFFFEFGELTLFSGFLLCRLVSTCPSCVGAFQRAKDEFRDKYARLFFRFVETRIDLFLLLYSYLRHYKPQASITNFANGVHNIERGSLLSTFAAVGFDIPPPQPQNPPWHPSHSALLSDVPLAAVYTILASSRFFEDDDILKMLLSGLPLTAPLPLPRKPAPGLLALRLHQSHLFRGFAEIHLMRCTELPSSAEYRAAGLARVVDSHLGVLASRDRGQVDAHTGIRLIYTDQRKEFMAGLASCLSKLSSEAIRVNLVRQSTSPTANSDVVHLVASHLSDAGDHLEGVLSCFKVLLERLGAHFWSVGDEKYEEIVLHAILDNHDFHEAFETDPLIAAAGSSAQGPLDSPWLNWLPAFLASVAHSPTLFTNSLALIAATFLDRLQQQRFDSLARTRALQVAVSLLSDVFLNNLPAPSASSSSNGHDLVAFTPLYPHVDAASKILDLHAATLANFAFSATYATPEWTKAVDTARGFVLGVAKRDGKAVARSVYQLASYSQQYLERERKEQKRAAGDAKAKAEAPAPVVAVPPCVTYTKALWDHAYAAVREQDVKAIGVFLQLVAPMAQFEKLTSRSWRAKDQIRPQMKAVNDALTTMRDPIVELLMNFADERVDLLLELLGQPGVVHQLLALLFSPVETVHNTAQGLVKQAFDVTTRRDVFRCMMARWPEATLRGLAAAIQGFQKSAKSLPEACGLAKRLVRCLSDVLDVLTAKTDGLIRDADFVKRGREFKLQSKLLALWNYMGGALALLFKRVPEWAAYFENDEMTEWMRDAIVFGSDLLDQIRTFEATIGGQSLDRSASGIITVGGASPEKGSGANGASKESTMAAQMIGALSDPLEELVGWLRLNDEDLLLQSYNLVMRMLGRFTRSGIALRDTVVARLRKMAVRPKGEVRETRSTILRDAQLLEIREALEDNEDAINRKKGGVEVLELSDDDGKLSSSSSLRIKSSVSTSTSSGPSQSKLPWPVAGKPSASSSKPRPAVPASARQRGVPWTTYSSKKEEESDSESSEDEDVVRGPDGKKLTGLALLARDQKAPIRIRKVEPKKAVKTFSGLGGPPGQPGGRGQQVRVERSKEDLQALRAARLKSAQDFSRLHRSILQWDPANNDDYPPGVDVQKRLASEFRSPKEYFASFEPLLLTECWEQVRQAKLEAMKEGQVILADIAGRQSIDDFVDVFCTVDHGQLRDRMFFGDSDLVWLRQGTKQIFAKIQSVNRKREHIELTMRCHLGSDVHGAGYGLAPRTKWEMLKLAKFVLFSLLSPFLLHVD